MKISHNNISQKNLTSRYRLPALALSAMLVVGFVFWRYVGSVLAEEVKGGVAETSTNPDLERLNAEIQSKKQLIEDIRRRIEERNQQIKEKRGQAASLKNQIGILENRIAKTELDIQETTVEIDTVQLEIRGLAAAIDERAKEIELHKTYVAEYLRAMYRYDERGYLEVLLLHDKFSEFFDALKALENVEESLTERVLSLKDQKAILETQKSAREEKEVSLLDLRRKLEDASERLHEEQSGKEVLVAAVQQSEQELRRSVAELRGEQQAIDNELVTLENSLRKKLRENNRFKAIKAPGKISWPVPFLKITTYFHDPDYPFRHVMEHPGLDLRAGQGTPVRVVSGGVVARAKDAGMGYSFVMILHPGGLSTVYGHLSKILVKEDQYVEEGDVVALSGGRPGTPGAGRMTTGAHLHFETRLNGIPINPLEYLQ